MIPPPAAASPDPHGGAEEARPFAFTRLLVKLEAGTAWASPRGGWACVAQPKLTWKGGQQNLLSAAFADAFREEMKPAGFKVEGESDNIFEKTAATSDIQVGGIIHGLSVSFCLPQSGAGDTSTVHGESDMEIEWQIYSSIQKTVLARIETRGAFQFKALAGCRPCCSARSGRTSVG